MTEEVWKSPRGFPRLSRRLSKAAVATLTWEGTPRTTVDLRTAQMGSKKLDV